ncbi:MAG: hypothetical protein QNK11_01165 [Legionella sp.]|nr:hypothetical protein [Legionella sp.]
MLDLRLTILRYALDDVPEELRFLARMSMKFEQIKDEAPEGFRRLTGINPGGQICCLII